jgi:hypothetical protein
LLAVILFLSNCAFSIEKPTSETSSSEVSIKFLNIEEAKAEIINDSIDPYFSRLQPMEMSAKTGSPIEGRTIEEQRQQCRERYQAGVRQFSDEEKEIIRRCVNRVYSVLEKKYPLFAKTPWSFLKVSDEIEGGLPHTRDKYIVLSESTCNRIAAFSRTDPERVFQYSGLLVHEQMHVFQRVNPDFFDSLYTDMWGFIKAGEIDSCPWLDKHQLINPDGTDCCWVLPVKQADDTRYILPLVVFAEGGNLKRMPNDFRMIAVEMINDNGHFSPKLTGNSKPIFKDLFKVPEYCRVFPTTMNMYHPNESCASVFTDIALADLFNLQRQQPDNVKKELDRLKKWFTENLKEKAGVSHYKKVEIRHNVPN